MRLETLPLPLIQWPEEQKIVATSIINQIIPLRDVSQVRAVFRKDNFFKPRLMLSTNKIDVLRDAVDIAMDTADEYGIRDCNFYSGGNLVSSGWQIGLPDEVDGEIILFDRGEYNASLEVDKLKLASHA